MYTTLIGTADLAHHINDAGWIIFDCRHDLGNPEAGRRAYAEGHISGARFAHLDENLSGLRDGANGRHPLPDLDRLCAFMRANGVNRDSQLVAYDATGGMSAARLWWLMRWCGHT